MTCEGATASMISAATAMLRRLIAARSNQTAISMTAIIR